MMRASPAALVRGYAAFFALFIIYASVAAIVAAHRGGAGHHGAGHILLLAVVEISAAIAFCFRRVRPAGGVGLVSIFLIAATLTAFDGSFPANLIFYCGTVIFVALMDRRLRAEDDQA